MHSGKPPMPKQTRSQRGRSNRRPHTKRRSRTTSRPTGLRRAPHAARRWRRATSRGRRSAGSGSTCPPDALGGHRAPSLRLPVRGLRPHHTGRVPEGSDCARAEMIPSPRASAEPDDGATCRQTLLDGLGGDSLVGHCSGGFQCRECRVDPALIWPGTNCRTVRIRGRCAVTSRACGRK